MAVFRHSRTRCVPYAARSGMCGISFQHLVKALNKRREAQGLTQLMFHIRYQYGAMVAGNKVLPTDGIHVMGKAVIIAARLTSKGGLRPDSDSEAHARYSFETGHIVCGAHSTITLPGTMQPLSIYSVVDVVGERRRDMD